MVQALLVDDHALFRAGMCMLLGSLSPGIEVSQASDLSSALNLLRDEPHISLILLDLHMPGCTGLSALRAIRESADTVPVVVLSGDDNAELVREAIEAGAMGYVYKSIEPEGMLSALNIILGGGVYLPPLAPSSSVSDASRFDVSTTRQRLANLGITTRQADVLFKAVQGKSNKVIARELNIADSTVKSHLMAVFDLLGVDNRTQLVYEIAKRGFTWPELSV